MKAVCVFCGSAMGARPAYADAARAMGAEIARRGLSLVYGGASVGLMGVVADAALAAGGQVVGVIPQRLGDRELSHPGLSELVVVRDMAERKAEMARRSDAFVALPGGFGTMDEIFEMLTWQQLGISDKRTGLLEVDGYWESLTRWIERAEADGFVRPPHHGLMVRASDPAALLDLLES